MRRVLTKGAVDFVEKINQDSITSKKTYYTGGIIIWVSI
jgi:hypothetical protein